MRVLILTNKEHFSFIHEWYGKYCYDYEIWLYVDGVEEFPKDYDIGISFMYTHKVPAKEVNTHPWFNFHPGPLPEYKGRNLCYHAIMNGETKFGASLHYMDENFDTGAIIDVWHFDIEQGATAHDVSRWTIETAKAMFQDYFPQILENIEFSTIPNEGGRYYKKESISDILDLNCCDTYIKTDLRAKYFPPHYPKIEIGGVTYKIVRDE